MKMNKLMQPLSHIRAKLIGLAVMCTLAPGVTFTSHAVELDQATLVEGLARYGMSDLLDRFASKQTFGDPVIDPLIKIARFRIAMEHQAQTRDEQLEAFDQMAQAMRALISQHYDHEQRPLWQTDLAEQLLLQYLPRLRLYAVEFCEFGVPTQEQRQARDQAVPEALELLSDADLRFFQLQTDLPREPNHFENRVVTGLWDRMMKEYYKASTPYLLGQAAYFTSSLGEDHPYYQNLGQNPRLPRQRKDPAQERARLLDLAIEKLQPFTADLSDPYRLRLASTCVMARAMLHQSSNVTAAREKLETVIGADKNDSTDLVAHLAKARALDMDNQHAAAIDTLTALKRHPVVEADPIYRLLTVDQIHLSLLARAQETDEAHRAQSVNKSYEVYEQLLTDPQLGEYAGLLKNYIYKRWGAALAGNADVGKMSPVVVRAVGEILLIEGQNLAIEAKNHSNEGQTQLAKDLREEAFPKLDESIRLNTLLIDQPQAPPSTRADAMFNLGWALYFRAQDEEIDTAMEIEAAKTWTDMADQLPGQPNAEQAITTAVAVLHPMFDNPGRPPQIGEAYERACQVMFDKFPTCDAADNERVYYAFHVLSQRGRYEEAVAILSQAPPNHPSYFEARREMLVNLKAILDQGDKPLDQESAVRRLVETATALLREIDQLRSPTPDSHKTKGWAKLMLVDAALARNEIDKALNQLEGFEKEFEDEPDLVRQALQRGIVALAQADRFDDVVIRAEKMMEMFPDDASVVIDDVLTDLDRQIESLRAQAVETLVTDEAQRFRDRAIRTARSAEQLARLLRDWALKQDLNAQEMLFYDLLLAKAVRMAGKPDGAIDLLKPILEQFPNDPTILHQMAEALYSKGDETSMVEAGNAYYDTLIAGLDGQDDPELKRLWWNAWMRRLQISDRIDQGTDVIALRVRQLEITDPSLGGEPFRSEMKRLELKHAR